MPRVGFQAKEMRFRDGSQHDETTVYHGEMSHTQRFAIKEVSRLGREKRWQEALDLYAQASDRTLPLYTATMDACAKSLQLNVVRQLFEEAPQKTRPAYNILVFLLGRLRKTREAEALVKEMREVSILPNVMTYGSLISTYGRARDVDSALRVLDEMEAAGVKANTIIFATALNAAASVGNSEETQALLARMDAANVEPNVGHFTSAIKSCSRTRNEEGGRAHFNELLRRGLQPDVVAWTCLMSCLPKPDVLAKAEAMLAEMRAAGITPTEFTYGTLLRAAIESEDIKKAREYWAEIEALDMPRTTLVEHRQRQLQDLEAKLAGGSPAQDRSSAAGSGLPNPPQPPLPAGWREALDPASGQTYYWAAADPAGTTTWTRPVA